MDYDTELRLHNRILFEACEIKDHDRVLDIGCGTGQTTRDAARLARRGNVLGIDIAERSIEKARVDATAEGLQNVRFEQGDAQAHAFLPRSFDLMMSRYGTMFFSDPVEAFRNIHSALSPDGRLAMLVWQSYEKNEWSVAIEESLGPHFSPQESDRQHFSLGDAATVRRILEEAGFSSITIDEGREPVYYGPDVDAGIQWVSGFRFVQDLLHRVGAEERQTVLRRLRSTMEDRLDSTGVWFPAREWIVRAHV